MPPPLEKPPPTKPSQTAQPNLTKNIGAEQFRDGGDAAASAADAARRWSRRARGRIPRAGGQPDSGGNPASNDTDALSAAQRGEIGAHVRECWTKDSGAQGSG